MYIDIFVFVYISVFKSKKKILKRTNDAYFWFICVFCASTVTF